MLGQLEVKLVNATMVLTKTPVPTKVTAGRKLPLSKRLRQFVKFCLVGGSGTLVDMGVLYVLADPKALALNIAFSKICAAEVALVNNFVWNEFWTFRSSDSGAGILPVSSSDKPSHARQAGSLSHSPRLRRFLFFNAICGLGILFAVLLLHLFHTLLGWNLYVSNLVTIGLVTLWNFGMNARFNWHCAPMQSPSDVGPNWTKKSTSVTERACR
ncbi:MAG: GtrA family protein [Verrucomicrobia bacterium]|nr:GtrA family protein [Verrucomicrobiota bacterium]